VPQATMVTRLMLDQIEIELRQRHGLFDLADIAAQRLRDHGRLLEDLLLHEVAVIALLDLRRRRARVVISR
jgi:hypothetical protein